MEGAIASSLKTVWLLSDFAGELLPEWLRDVFEFERYEVLHHGRRRHLLCGEQPRGAAQARTEAKGARRWIEKRAVAMR